jgi:YjjG family noncanonical pyrimidine nucleotidase
VTDPSRFEGVRAVFFDMDETLWDHRLASRESFSLTLAQYAPEVNRDDLSDRYQDFERYNEQLWEAYAQGQYDAPTVRLQRFQWLLQPYGVTEERIAEISRVYLERYAKTCRPTSGARQLLEGLSRRYLIGILTNGFSDVQQTKLDNSGLSPFISFMITSEAAGSLKPSPGIFIEAVRRSGFAAAQCVLIGDSYTTDIMGAKRAGLRTIWLNTRRQPAPSDGGGFADAVVHSMEELPQLLGLRAV